MGWWSKNPGYLYALIGDLLMLAVGFGLALTGTQVELVMKAVASAILVITGVAVGAGQATPPTDGTAS